MLEDILFLWNNRERPIVFNRWLKVWAKRFFHFINLVKLLSQPIKFRFKGANIGRLVVLGNSRVEGKYSNLRIGNETSLGRCHLTLHDQVIVGNRVVINDGAIILTAGHSLQDPHWQLKKAPVVIGDYAWVATNAMILPGVTIGRGAVIGAGAVVREDISEYGVVIGNPAQLTSKKRTDTLTYSPVLLNAPFEAWIGNNLKQVNIPDQV